MTARDHADAVLERLSDLRAAYDQARVQEATPTSSAARAAALSLVLGAELRLWAVCTSPGVRHQSIAVPLLASDLNLRPITSEDRARKQRKNHPSGASRG